MTELLVLRVVHVLGGVFWVGAGIFTGVFLMPALAKAGPATAQLMEALQQRRLFVVLPLVATLTILSGLRLMWLTSAGFAPAYFATTRGTTFAASGIAAVLAFTLSLLVARPAAARTSVIMPRLESSDDATRAALTAELHRLRQRSALASRAALWLLILSASGMAVARYLP
jgi:uncharacterized membrane protein